jgi:hypothetical protein
MGIMSEPYLLHQEQTFPAAWELAVPEMAGDDWPGPAWGSIWCQRADDGSWSIWYVGSDENGDKEELERVSGLTTAEAFCAAYHDCGVDFGCHPDGTDLDEHLDYFEREDPHFASLLRTYWNE